MKNKPFKQLVLETWKYDGFEKAKEEEEEELIDLGGTDTNSTPHRNLEAYIASSQLTPSRNLGAYFASSHLTPISLNS
jgi:hypothetical protein